MTKEIKVGDMSTVLSTIEGFAEEVESKFNGLLDSLSDLKDDLKQIGQLKELVCAAESMLDGHVSQPVDSEAKGEVGRLFTAINETLKNLQKLDQSVQVESDKVPELAAHLDLITQETETATQQVLEKLDVMLDVSDKQAQHIEQLKNEADQRLNSDRNFYDKINVFLGNMKHAEDKNQMIVEAISFMTLAAATAKENLSHTESTNQSIADISDQGILLQDQAFDIMNLLQFQDITRQKISKVIGLLKELQDGMKNLLSIFNLDHEQIQSIQVSEKHLATQDRILDRETNVDGKDAIDVDAIIASFQGK